MGAHHGLLALLVQYAVAIADAIALLLLFLKFVLNPSCCPEQDLGLDPIVANLELERVNPHLRQLAQATQG